MLMAINSREAFEDKKFKANNKNFIQISLKIVFYCEICFLYHCNNDTLEEHLNSRFFIFDDGR